MAQSETGDEHPDAASRDRRHGFTIPRPANLEGARPGADTTRADLLHAIDGQLAQLNQLIGAHHAASVESKHMAMLTEAASHLSALRGQVETARSPYQLASLRLTLAGAVQNAGTAMMSVAAGPTAQQQLAARLYETRMTAAERGMAEISRRDGILFATADDRAEQLGLDVGFFRDQRRLLEAEVEAARKRGERFGAIVPEGLLAHNTANMLDEIAERSGDPDDRKRAAAARRNAAAADQQVREAARIEAERAAADREFASEAERDKWVAADADGRFDKYQQRVNALHRPDQGPDHRKKLADLTAERSRHLASMTEDDRSRTDAALAALPAEVRDAAKAVGRPVAQDTSAAQADTSPKVPDASPVNIAAARSAPGGSVTF